MSNVIKLNSLSAQKLSVKFKEDFEDLSQDELHRRELNNKLQQNYDKGFSEGYSSAKSELEKVFNQRLENKSEEFNLIMKSVDERLSGYDTEFEKLVVQLSFEIASRIIRKEVKTDSNIEPVLREALKKVLGANNIIVKLHPDDLKSISDNNKRGSFIDESISKVKFEEDERIEKGGCVVETEIGNVDARIASQLNELNKYFNPSNEL